MNYIYREYLKTPYKDGGVYATIYGVEYYTLSNVLPTWAQYGTFSGEFQWQKKSSPPYTP